ncbi:MAG: hypothetical protein H0U42_10160 [Thermoleophilaceae bacterium]|nr:hypothetical protein [Thermoleophilaceae bacterium]
MGIGTSIFLIAAGAILRWGVADSFVLGLKLDVIGLILIGVGVLGLILSLILMQQARSRVDVVERDQFRQPPRV